MKHILITNSNSLLYETARLALQAEYKLEPFTSSTLQSDHLTDLSVDGILLTVTSSDTDCMAMYHRIKSTPELEDKPVILFSEQINPSLEEWALKARVQEYLTLPISPELLLLRVKNCLELYALRSNHKFAEKIQDAISYSFAELVEFRDETTGGHLKNTTQYFHILLEEAIESGYYTDLISKEDMAELLRSATLHDIGKIGINDEILHKESSLDYHEYEYMKTHTTLGREAFERIIKETGGTRWLYLAKDIAYCHHEHWDGTGYPNGLKGEEIPVYARMLTVVDVYDALTSRRSYKEAYSHEKAIEIILEEKGTLFDPQLVDLFVHAQKRFKEVLLSKNDHEIVERK